MSFESEFRTNFPEFTSTTNYTSAQIEFWRSIAELRLNEERWGDLLTHGMQLFVAHNLSLAYQESKNAAKGAAAGQSASGLKNNKSVGNVSVGYDTSSVAIKDAGNYNLTTYGRNFIELANLVGIGGLQLLGDIPTEIGII
jgi:hypothetical protein